MSWVHRLLQWIAGRDKTAALIGDLEEEAARTNAGRVWMTAQIAALVMAAAWVIGSSRAAALIRGLRHDTVFAVRLFRRRPGPFGLTIAGLAVAIGLSTTVFSILKAVAFADYGVTAPESVFRVALGDGVSSRPVTGDSLVQGNWGFSDYAELDDAISSLDAVASVGGRVEFRTDPDRDPERVTMTAVSGDYFQVLGMRTTVGRSLTRADAAPGLTHAVVSHGYWKNRLASDPSVVGRSIWIGDRRFTIVGVAARMHSGPGYSGEPPAFWTSLAAHRDMWNARAGAQLDETRARLRAAAGRAKRDAVEAERLAAIEKDLAAPPRAWNPAVEVLGRLKPGVTRERAEAEVRAIGTALAGRNPGHGPSVELEPLDKRDRTAAVAALIVAGIVALVVFLACANATNVLLASAAARRREIGTRLAIGASRGRIVSQLLTESVMLGAIAGALGFVLAVWFLPAFAAFVQVPPAFDVSPDPTAYVFVGLLTLASGIIVGLAPARYGRRGDLVSALKTDQVSAPLPLPRARLRTLLIGAQAAVSVVLLLCATLLVRVVVQAVTLDLGYDPSRLAVVHGSPIGRTWDAPRRDAFWSAAMENVKGVPGVESVSLAGVTPFSAVMTPSLNGREILRNHTSPDYFATLGIRVIRGRIYSSDEVKNGAPVAVISARLAREFWDGSDPIGSSLERVWGPDDLDDAGSVGLVRKPRGTRIIGIVSDAVTVLRYQDAPTIYLPISETIVPVMVVRTRDQPQRSVRAMRDAVQGADPTVRSSIAFPIDGLNRELEGPRTMAVLAVIVGAMALGLAVIGIFGVTAFIVEQRAHEVSVRRALGATAAQIVMLLFRDSLKPVLAGLACGLALSIAGGSMLRAVLYGVDSRDPLAFAAAAGLLLVAAIAAVLVPARRAVRVSPAHLLKQG